MNEAMGCLICVVMLIYGVGFTERTIQTFKHSLKKAMASKKALLALLAIRTTPSKHLLSPAQKLMGHTLRTTVPPVCHVSRLLNQ